jgi:hypothetical protein
MVFNCHKCSRRESDFHAVAGLREFNASLVFRKNQCFVSVGNVHKFNVAFIFTMRLLLKPRDISPINTAATLE